MSELNCKKLDQCHKVAMVLDKDFPEEQYREIIQRVCAKCEEKE